MPHACFHRPNKERLFDQVSGQWDRVPVYLVIFLQHMPHPIEGLHTTFGIFFQLVCMSNDNAEYFVILGHNEAVQDRRAVWCCACLLELLHKGIEMFRLWLESHNRQFFHHSSSKIVTKNRVIRSCLLV